MTQSGRGMRPLSAGACYVWEADSRPGSDRCAIEGDVETISWFLVIHNRLRAYQGRNKPRSRFVSFHQLQAHTPAGFRKRSHLAWMAMAPKHNVMRAYYPLVLTVSAERIELALFRQGSGSARKKSEST